MTKITTLHRGKEQLGAWTLFLPRCDIEFFPPSPTRLLNELNEAQAAAKLKLKLKPKTPPKSPIFAFERARHLSLPPGQMR